MGGQGPNNGSPLPEQTDDLLEKQRLRSRKAQSIVENFSFVP